MALQGFFFYSSSLFAILLVKSANTCFATSGSTSPETSTSACKSCTLDQITITMLNEGAKAFTSDTIDTSGTCAVRTSICVGNEADDNASISFNNDAAGTTSGTEHTATSTLTCDDAGNWIKTEGTDTAIITSLECNST